MNVKKLLIMIAVIGLASGLSINTCQKGKGQGGRQCRQGGQGEHHHAHREHLKATRVNDNQVSVDGQIYTKTNEQCQWHMHGGQGHQHGHGHHGHAHGNHVDAKYVWNGEAKQEGVIRVREANGQCFLYRK